MPDIILRACSKCGTIAPIEHYHADKSAAGGRSRQCNACKRTTRLEHQRRVRAGKAVERRRKNGESMSDVDFLTLLTQRMYERGILRKGDDRPDYCPDTPQYETAAEFARAAGVLISEDQ